MGRLDYLDSYGSPNTVKAYKASLKQFFESVYEETGPLDELAERYFQEDRDVKGDFQNFLVAIKDRFTPKSARLKMSAVNMFLMENDVELPAKFLKRLRKRIKGSRAVTIEKIPSNKELRKIIMHLPAQGKAFFTILASSGMRIGEALQLQPGDFDLDEDLVKINVRGEYTKTGNQRIAFISREAKELLQEWLRLRSSYLKTAVARSGETKTIDDPRVFPFTDNTAYFMWNLALKKTGNGKRDVRTNWHQTHPHVLRKFFRTKLASVIALDIVEALMGHEGYLTEVYRRYSEEDLAKFYKEGEHALLVFTEAAEVGKLRQEIEKQRDQLQTIVNGLATENLELKSRLARVELEITEVKKAQRALEKLMA